MDRPRTVFLVNLARKTNLNYINSTDLDPVFCPYIHICPYITYTVHTYMHAQVHGHMYIPSEENRIIEQQG